MRIWLILCTLAFVSFGATGCWEARKTPAPMGTTAAAKTETSATAKTEITRPAGLTASISQDLGRRQAPVDLPRRLGQDSLAQRLDHLDPSRRSRGPEPKDPLNLPCFGLVSDS